MADDEITEDEKTLIAALRRARSDPLCEEANTVTSYLADLFGARREAEETRNSGMSPHTVTSTLSVNLGQEGRDSASTTSSPSNQSIK